MKREIATPGNREAANERPHLVEVKGRGVTRSRSSRDFPGNYCYDLSVYRGIGQGRSGFPMKGVDEILKM